MELKKYIALSLSAIMLLSAAGCSKPAEAAGKFKAGTYNGSAKGFGGDLKVEVTLSADKIETVKVTENAETDGIGSKAIETLPGKIVETQSIEVDGVSGATVSSKAIIEAVTAALKSAVVDATTLKSTATDTGNTSATTETMDVDVVIVGAGGAGMTAAIEAANAGKKVVIVEKQAMTGGNTVRSTGGMNAGKTPAQDENKFEEAGGVEKTLEAAKKSYPELAELTATVEKQYTDYKAKPEGYFDSVELFMLDTLVGGKNLNDPELVKTLATNSSEGIDWLKTIGADLTSVSSFGGASVKRIHRPLDTDKKVLSVGSYLVPVMTKACEDKGVQFLYETPANELIVMDGKVTGVKAASTTTEYTINAKSVVLASGGFGANMDMVAELKPELKGYVTTNAPGINGDGIKMAEAAGAVTVDLEQIQIHPTVEQATSALITEGLRGDGAILVNAEGKRFTDEVGTRDAVSAAEIAQTGSYAYLIVDNKMVTASTVIAGYIKKGYTVEGTTVEELAKAMNVDAAAFAETMTTWNAAVAAKKDDLFGRTSFASPLDEGPFYAIKIAPGVHHTMGGLKINTNTEVLNAEGTAIAGLYAAGEVTGGVHGANRLGGNAVADIVVFGRIAGQQAATNAK